MARVCFIRSGWCATRAPAPKKTQFSFALPAGAPPLETHVNPSAIPDPRD